MDTHGTLCILPGISRSSICHIAPQRADYLKLMNVQSEMFQPLLDGATDSSAMSLEIRKMEMAGSNLVTLIRASNLRSEELVNTLVDFVEEAKKTGKGLQKLASKISGTVDSAIAINDYVFRALRTATRQSSLFNIIWPFSRGPETNRVVTEFIDFNNVLGSQMQHLILEAESHFANLNRLEYLLTVLQEIVDVEDESVSSTKSKLLSEPRTWLGGNGHELRWCESHLQLLRSIGTYRTHAFTSIATALHTLRKLTEGVKDLRDHIADAV
ncbi:hypothetical protein A0H81_02512 [Grifola frondosa]|uniref:Uncharacterized protein n=1 Tax=Grifola frondosa TaxID=5627 RepID=A0A1C7MKW4_GRIFR|nr:hypothetical protein A0H81_02512 [Grifola frondosa]